MWKFVIGTAAAAAAVVVLANLGDLRRYLRISRM
ncbi:DUF6893 family small protein [Kitasatospora sp. NE20-6]